MDSRRSQMSWGDFAFVAIYSPLIVVQFVVAFFFHQNHYGLTVVMYAGFAIWLLSLFFAFAPMLVLKRRGGVPEGKAYVHTTRLVTDGLYGIVRHPQYSAGLLLIVGLMMISQHWIVVVSGLIALPVFYYDIVREDRDLVRIFGQPYERYMERVPRTNFLLGLVRAARRGDTAT